jgi:prolyl-tRNA editing enzyme YbaK/EbsC (Cys-tRNA(Pro) deacylase)
LSCTTASAGTSPSSPPGAGSTSGACATCHLRLATEDELRRDFPGFDVGALPPFGLEPVPEVVDIRLVYRDKLLCAGGDHRHGVRLDPRDLLRLAEPRVADICEHDAGDHRFADVPKI